MSVNGVIGEHTGRGKAHRGNTAFTCAIPANALPGDNRDTIEVRAAAETEIRVLSVEVWLGP